MTSQQPRRQYGRSGAAALSLALHCGLLLLAALAVGGARPPGKAAARAPVIIALEPPGRPEAAAAAALHAAPPRAAPRAPRRPPAAAQPPAPSGSEAAAPPSSPEPPQPAPALAVAPAAPEPPVAAEPSGGAEPSASGRRPDPLPLLYLAEVSRLIQLSLDYPAQARLDRARGTAVVHILLARDGTVLEVELVQGAGHPALDEEARKVVLRIHKFPELPEGYARGEQRFAIDQPIGFRGG